VGPKHCGKTSAGLALREALIKSKSKKFFFLDTDALVEKGAGKTVRELFRESPAAFRAAEGRVWHLLARSMRARHSLPLVIAAGGGLADNPCALKSLEKARRAAAVLVVYLDISAETAWRRIAESGALPPFLASEDDPLSAHRALHERRTAAYKQLATLTIEAGDKPPETIAGEIVRFVQAVAVSQKTRRGRAHNSAKIRRKLS
jgi:shikimate kinase